MKKLLLIALPLLLLLKAGATVKLPSIISNNMVLQQQTKVALWGWGAPGEKVSITTSWNESTSKVTAGADGKWITYVKTGKAGGPFYITFAGTNEIKVENVMLGEVWIAAGQSNMEFFMAKTKNSSYTGVLDYENEIKKADYFGIRMIDVANKVADEPQYEFKGDWKVCSPATADTFSAVAFYFAKEVHTKTGFPVGIINATWGGTPAESWTKKEVLEKDKDFKVILDRYDQQVKEYPAASAVYKAEMEKWKADTSKHKEAAPKEPMGPNSSKSPYKLYNGMIVPVEPYTLKGVIWYQGENNAEHPYQYRRLFPAMIENWREDFKNTSLPFYFVQISPHRSQNPEIREAQLLTYRNVPHTGMAVTVDNGDSVNIHPRNKKLVGERLSLWALHDLYGQKDLVFSGPLYKSMKVAGSKIRIQFDYVDGGLVAKGDAELKEFTIAGEDEKFVPAHAVIEGNEVVVWSDEVNKPVAVRFAWRNVPVPNLYNKSLLPASPFRTDSWKGQTEGKN